mgnify:CR=1 FL=1
MNVLITYDVNTMDRAGARRLRKVAKACVNYGHRVQNSVFECNLSESQLCILKDELKGIIDSTSDSIRIYTLNKNESRRVEVIGIETAVNFDSTIII